MSGFSFNATAGSSQSTVKAKLVGNEIYTVKFDGCELKEFNGSKDPSALYKVLVLSFSNEDGAYEHTVFEPRPEDFDRGESTFTGKDGKENKIPQPSNVESMMLLFKHAIDVINPKVAAAIDKGDKSLGAPDWDGIRKLVKQILDAGKGTETKIKLIINKKGDGVFPGFFAAVNREGSAYIRNNFIGGKIAFTPYEIGRIQKAAEATPTDMGAVGGSEMDLSKQAPADDLDLTFNVSDL